MNELRHEFQQGKIDQYDYMSKHHEFNKLLFGYSKILNETDISSIEISGDKVIFVLKFYDIKMESDGSCRSAPLEMLNFNHYEPSEHKMLLKLLKNGDVIFDVGAHLGFYSLVLSKAFPLSRIYAFEPVSYTFSYLQKNIQNNVCTNVQLFNYGLSNEMKDVFFHYFKGGSALASQMNLIGHKTDKVKCHLERLDDVIYSLNVERLDCVKCDIEGGELAAIQGGMESIKKFLPIIFIEFYEEWCQKFHYSANDALNLLNSIGYECFSVTGNGLKNEKSITNENGIYNYFFLHSKKHKSLMVNIV